MYYIRSLRDNFLENLNNDLILVLSGARQTGKTTFLKHVLHELEKKQRCFFVNLEDPEFLDILNKHPDNIFKITNTPPTEKQTIFIDEIQYLNDPSNFLKYIYDEYKGTVKLIVSGSSSFYLDTRFKDSLVGRKRLFRMYTLDFVEFLRFKEKSELSDEISKSGSIGLLQKKELIPLFTEYITYGGYPAVVLENNYENKELLLSEIALDYIKKDIYEANIQDQNKYYFILKMLARQAGSLVNNNEIANTLGIAATTVEKYLYIMQKSFQLALIRPFYSNVRKELTKMPKVFFYDTGLRNYFAGSFENIELREDKGALLENIVFRELLFRNSIEAIKFWRTQNKNEIDFIVNEKQAFEVKFKKSECRESRYNLFKTAYPQIDFSFITYEDVIQLGLKQQV
ncbi:MAG: ATP-binding protein [Candidatus Margulisiibacteriota bacterium]